jgi:L-fuconolactonase
VKLADAHIHLFRRGYAARYGAAFARTNELQLYSAMRQEHNIGRALVVGYEGDRAFAGNNKDLAAWRRRNNWIAALAYCDTARPPSLAELQTRRSSFVGISLYAMSPESAQALSIWPEAVTEWLAAQRSIVSINVRAQFLPLLSGLLSRLDGCAVLLSHLALPGSFREPPSRTAARRIYANVRAVAAMPWVGVKVSALYALSQPSHAYPHRSAHPFIREAYAAFGPRRLYWGSDYSPALEHVSFAQTIDAIRQAPFPARDLPAIMGGNLVKIIPRAEGA